jgi:hypothetical protein
MTDKISAALDPLIQTINNKIVNLTVAGGVAVAGKAAQTTENTHLKSLAEIPVTEIFSHELNAAAVATAIGTSYIIFQFAREGVRGIVWLWNWYRARKN